MGYEIKTYSFYYQILISPKHMYQIKVTTGRKYDASDVHLIRRFVIKVNIDKTVTPQPFIYLSSLPVPP